MQVAPVKGVEGFNRAAPVAGPTHVDATKVDERSDAVPGCRTVAVAPSRPRLNRFLRLTRPTATERAAGALTPSGYIHLAQAAEAEWVKQLVAEQLGHGEDQAWLPEA